MYLLSGDLFSSTHFRDQKIDSRPSCGSFADRVGMVEHLNSAPLPVNCMICAFSSNKLENDSAEASVAIPASNLNPPTSSSQVFAENTSTGAYKLNTRKNYDSLDLDNML